VLLNSNTRYSGKFCNLAATTCMAVALLACGGGGGGGGGGGDSSPSTNGNFSGSADLAKLSPVLIKTVLPGSSGDSSAVGVFSAENQQKSALDGLAPSHSLMKFVTAAIHTAKASSTTTSSGQIRALAVESATDRCFGGGSVTTTVDDADNNEELSAGDRIELRYSSCVSSNSQTTVGSFQIRINAVEIASNGALVAYDASVIFQNFGVLGRAQFSGNARLSYREVGTRDLSTLEFQGVATAVNGYAVVLNHKESFDTGVGSVQGSISIKGASYSMSSTNLNYNNANAGYPLSGSLRTVDARGNAIVITAKGSSVGRSYIAAGQTTPELTLPDTSWVSIN